MSSACRRALTFAEDVLCVEFLSIGGQQHHFARQDRLHPEKHGGRESRLMLRLSNRSEPINSFCAVEMSWP